VRHGRRPGGDRLARPGASSYLACLRQHGVIGPVARPSSRPTARPGGASGAANSAFAQARGACAALRPAGGRGGQFGTALQAFRSCTASHGEAIPATRPTATPTARPTAPPSPRNNRFLNGLNASDPKVAAALKACEPKLPAFGRPSPAAG
jgi:hypothetical protein